MMLDVMLPAMREDMPPARDRFSNRTPRREPRGQPVPDGDLTRAKIVEQLVVGRHGLRVAGGHGASSSPSSLRRNNSASPRSWTVLPATVP